MGACVEKGDVLGWTKSKNMVLNPENMTGHFLNAMKCQIIKKKEDYIQTKELN